MLHRLCLAIVVVFLWSLLGSAGLYADSPDASSQPSKHLEPFSLQDYQGRWYSLDDFREQNLLVIAFLGTECPLAGVYGKRLAELHQRYKDRGVAFVGVDSNVQDSLTEIAAYARRLRIEFPILKDTGNRFADALGAERTPEVFLFDRDRMLRYRGRIDDQYGISVVRPAAEQRFLEKAIEELLQGKPVSIASEPAVGCIIGRVRRPDPAATVTYSRHIAPILQKHCVSCHRPGEIGPFSLTDYAEVAGWAEMILEVVEQGRMPPWHASPEHGKFRNENRLSDEEKGLLRAWVESGAPAGNLEEVPPLPQFVEGWQLPRQPDLVIPMSDKPFSVPARGEVRYQYFVVDPGFTEDKWIQAAELRPGNRAVVHHILVFARRGPLDSDEGGLQGFLVGYVPGMRVEPLPAGMAKRIPAGSKLIFQVHYTPVGTPQEDRSELGLIFANEREVSYEVVTTSAFQRRLRIPPGEQNYRAEATRAPLVADSLLLALMPHMHLRGKAFRYEAIFPDGTRQILLDVPHYDFNWQTRYILEEPMSLPAGTRIHCTATYDNSAKNLNNPDPSQWVTWGDQTWDEMMIGYFDIALPMDVARDRRRLAVERARQIMERLDRNRDGILERQEVPPAFHRVFDRLDLDGDGKLGEEEIAQSID